MRTNKVFNGKPGLIGELKKRELFSQTAVGHIEDDIADNKKSIVQDSKSFAKRALTTAGFAVANTVVNGLSVLTDAKLFDFVADVNNLAHINSDVIAKLNEVCPVSILGTLAVTAGMFATFSALRTNDFNQNIDNDRNDIKDLNTYSKLCIETAKQVDNGFISYKASVNDALNTTLQRPSFDENGGITKVAPSDFDPTVAENTILDNISQEEFSEIDEAVNQKLDDALRQHHFYQDTANTTYSSSQTPDK